MWEFASGNTFSATAFTSYGNYYCFRVTLLELKIKFILGGFWISYALISLPWSGIAGSYTSKLELEAAVGFYVFGWAIFTFILFLASFRSSIALVSLFAVLELTFLLLGASYFYADQPAYQLALVKASGWTGLILAGMYPIFVKID